MGGKTCQIEDRKENYQNLKWARNLPKFKTVEKIAASKTGGKTKISHKSRLSSQTTTGSCQNEKRTEKQAKQKTGEKTVVRTAKSKNEWEN